VPSGAPKETQVGWIQSLLYPSLMLISQKSVSNTSRCQWTKAIYWSRGSRVRRANERPERTEKNCKNSSNVTHVRRPIQPLRANMRYRLGGTLLTAPPWPVA